MDKWKKKEELFIWKVNKLRICKHDTKYYMYLFILYLYLYLHSALNNHYKTKNDK